MNGFASSENGDEGRDKEAEGEEKVDEKYSECVENGETEKNGVDETEEEEAEVSADMKDADSCDTHGSPDAQDEEAAVEVAEDGGRPSTAVSRCLTEDFEAAESENPQCSPQHRASLRGPTTACNTTTSSSSTISKRVCNTKKWLTSIPTKQAPGASEPADNASSRGSASAKAGARGSEKSGAFADLFNSALDMVAGGQQNQPSAGRCEGLEELVATAPTDDDDLSGCLLNLAAAATSAAATAAAEQTGGSDLSTLVPSGSNSDVTLALLQRQRELRLVCAANHSVLHRLIQAARRDLQRQEIQRRLAIADADVIEAYNKLEGYRLHHRPALKRDRDAAWKTLKERQKIRAELEAFDRKGP
ncbi:unnamed protein product [Schistocephalus solidus]|uniref:Transcriptional adapter 3 n=1 Tax=Schistocephalus solidus TaxID=70667 RepID=A0A3P7DZS6_SCHSO|nr:unnamed protein product [Schistocephalus solidus]